MGAQRSPAPEGSVLPSLRPGLPSRPTCCPCLLLLLLPESSLPACHPPRIPDSVPPSSTDSAAPAQVLRRQRCSGGFGSCGGWCPVPTLGSSELTAASGPVAFPQQTAAPLLESCVILGEVFASSQGTVPLPVCRPPCLQCPVRPCRVDTS